MSIDWSSSGQGCERPGAASWGIAAFDDLALEKAEAYRHGLGSRDSDIECWPAGSSCWGCIAVVG